MNKRTMQMTVLLGAAIIVALFIKTDGGSRITNRDIIQKEKKFTPFADEPMGTVATSTTAIVTSTNATIIRAVDGDTIIAVMDRGSQEVKIRLLGVNTPESVDPRRTVECFGKEASHFTTSLVLGKRVRLEEDPEADDLDKYGRSLRNVILEDGTDLNLALVREGYGYAYTKFPQNKKRKAEINRLQREAETNKRGLWNPETCAGKK